MQHDDPLIRLLRSADTAAREPAPSSDLADRALTTARHRDARSWLARRGALGTCAAAAVLLIVVAIRGGLSWHDETPSPVEVAQHTPDGPSAPESPARDDATEIARLRAEADAYRAQADALERELNFTRNELARQEFLEEYRQRIVRDVANELTPSGVDRAAAIVLREGDLLPTGPRRPQRSDPRVRAVTTDFRDTPSAAIAHERLVELHVN